MDKRAPGMTRRQVLRGAGGFTLAIPFLPSLLPRSAQAATAARPRLFWFGTDHGGCWDTNFFPDPALLTSKAASAPGHMVASGPLTATTATGRTTLSPVLNASSTILTPRLVGKMNVLRGLDVPWYIAHNTGLHLGNYARNDNNGDCGVAVTGLGNRPTIDQIMAGSSSFYSSADLGGVKLRSMIINSGRALSWAFSNPAQGVASPVQNVQGVNSSQQLFTSLFGGSGAPTNPRPPVVDKILANYNSLRQSNTRLSAADKARLDAHIALVAQLQSSLGAHLSCTAPTAATDDASKHDRTHSKADAAAYGQLWADLVVAAFSCGASRIGVLGWGETSGFSDYVGTDWHHDVAHQWMDAQPQAWLTQSYQGFFEQVFLYLAAKLDQVDDGMGGSLLDSTLLVWSQESGMETHEAYGIPVVTCGAGAGFFKTGLYCDYRNVGETGGAIAPQSPAGYKTYAGLLYSQWLATVLQGMGIPPSEFELWKDATGTVQKGYGTPYLGSDWTPSAAWTTHYKSLGSPYYTTASTLLPFLKA
jgi:hypothetical protein